MTSPQRRFPALSLAFVALVLAATLSAQAPTGATLPLPSSKSLTVPVPGSPQPTNSLPVALALSPDGKYLAILNNGYGSYPSKLEQSIAVLDLATNQLRDFPDSRLGQDAMQTYFMGLAWSSDGKELYASIASLTDPEGKNTGDTGNGIAVYQFANDSLQQQRFLKLPLAPLRNGQYFAYKAKSVLRGYAVPYPAGIAVIKGVNNDQLLVAENLSDDVVLVDAASGRVLRRFDLSRGRLVPGEFPYTVVASRDGSRAWCSLWNGSEVAQLDLHSGSVVRRIELQPPKLNIEPSSHPTALLLSPNERELYVTLANRDAVAVIATAEGRVERYLDTRLPGQTYGGSFPNALAQSVEGRKLYVANASSDAVGVFDLTKPSEKQPAYFIPTEWYPTALTIQGDELFVATGKGAGTGPNSGWQESPTQSGKAIHPYIAALIRGSIARVNLRQAEVDQPKLTEEVLRSNRIDGRTGEITFQHGNNPIRHVIYIIKENRTYDQIFGDIHEANGDPSLVMYGEQITPNQHALARQFGILDNFYDSGEVSGDGHVWSTSAITTDYTEKTWPIVYRGKERMYDYEGYDGDYIPMNVGVPDVNQPSTGYLWGNLARHELTHRNYGEFVSTTWCTEIREGASASHPRMRANSSRAVGPEEAGPPIQRAPMCVRKEVKPGDDLPPNLGGGKSPYRYTIPLIAYDTPTKPELKDHYDPNYADFRLEYPDQFRTDEFLREFAGFVKARASGSGEQLPQFVLLRLPNDHTAGTRPGSPTPDASVADNDLAVGRVVEAVSNSPYWDDTAIFILEDDAQNGQDHVDAHRSIALVVSKYAPGSAQQPVVDHHFYTTVNMIHTMESLLGLPPMNANDAYAPVMAPLFTGDGKQTPFRADYRNRDNGMIYQANAADAPGAKRSSKLDFSHADAADANVLNAILWHAAKGSVSMPAPQHKVFPATVTHGDPDD